MKHFRKILKLTFAVVVITLMTHCANKFYKTGQNFYEAGNYKDALAQYDQWIQDEPDNSKAYIARAKAYEKLGEKEKKQISL